MSPTCSHSASPPTCKPYSNFDFVGHHALIYFHLVSQGLGAARYDLLSRTRLAALRKLFAKDRQMPRSERGLERDRVAREEGIKDLETATAAAKRIKNADVEGERRKSV